MLQFLNTRIAHVTIAEAAVLKRFKSSERTRNNIFRLFSCFSSVYAVPLFIVSFLNIRPVGLNSLKALNVKCSSRNWMVLIVE